jgi:hypothetical protein
VDEVGYIPFDPEAASLFFSLVSSRYEHSSLIVSSNKTFSAWAEIFGEPVAVAALVDRLVHHAAVIVLRGESLSAQREREGTHAGRTGGLTSGSGFDRRYWLRFRPALTPVDTNAGGFHRQARRSAHEAIEASILVMQRVTTWCQRPPETM